MRIRHYAGYGCVNAKKLHEDKSLEHPSITILVEGNHEMGLLRPFYDPSCIAHWFKSFIKDRTMSGYNVLGWGTHLINGETTDYAIYTLYVR